MNKTACTSQPCDLLKLIDMQYSNHMIWGNNCDVYTLINTNKFHIIHETILPWNKDKMHYHSVSDQFLYLLSGKIKVKLRNDTIFLKQYQGIMIPAKYPHYVENNENETAVLLTISAPGNSDDRVLMESDLV
jgi:mannose-6-phosphate isomerase-like protein (cupin superfamily)